MADVIDLDAISSAVNQAYGGKASKGKASMEDLNSDFSARVAQMQAAYKDKFGKDLPIVSGRRTTEEQRQLYEKRGTNPYPVAAPGTSKHETGNAIDIPKSVPDDFLAQFGLHRPNKKDPVHVEMMAKQTPSNEPGSLLDIGSIDALVKDVYANPSKEKQSSFVTNAQKIAQAKEKFVTPQAAASALDIISGGVTSVLQLPGYWAGRAFGLTPEEAQKASAKVPETLAQPIGRIANIEQTPAYQQSLPSQAAEKVGELAKEYVVNPIAEKTGKSPIDVEMALATAGAALPAVPAIKAKMQQQLARAKMTAQPGTMSPDDIASMQAQFKAKRNAPVSEANAPIQSAQGQLAPGGSLGSAAATNETMLQEAIGRASPQLAIELKKIDPASVNPAALDNYLKADQFGIRLSKGQATGDPYLISVEQNERGLKKQLAEDFNEQNRTLTAKADEIKQKVGEDTFEVNYVGNAERTMDAFKEISAESDKAIKSAYKELDDLGAGKIEVDSKTFGDNAMKALTANEDIDFLPSTIKAKIEAYQGGKPMNFAQYENLRTQISRETRKAQRADDGNAVHALTIARSELEKLPLLNETAEAKVVADKARSLAAQEFGLLDKRRPTYNQVYADIVNGAADTKDFIPKVVMRSKNADFAKAMDMLETKPDSLNQLRAGTLDYMIREATDASGNFKTAKFSNMVEALDVNGKLTRLFGENSKQIKDLSDVGKLINARPSGSFVNTSNTTPAGAQLAKQYGMKLAQDVPVVSHLIEPVMTFRAERKLAREVEETMRPGAGAGTKLKDMIKEK